MRTTTKIFISKTKSHPACSHINIQLNFQINHGGDENLSAPRLELPDERPPPTCRKKGGNLEQQFPRSRLSAGQGLPTPASPGEAAGQVPTVRQHTLPGQEAAGERRERHVLYWASWGAHEQGLSHRGSASDGRHGCCNHLFPDICSPRVISPPQTAVCP